MIERQREKACGFRSADVPPVPFNPCIFCFLPSARTNQIGKRAENAHHYCTCTCADLCKVPSTVRWSSVSMCFCVFRWWNSWSTKRSFFIWPKYPQGLQLCGLSGPQETCVVPFLPVQSIFFELRTRNCRIQQYDDTTVFVRVLEQNIHTTGVSRKRSPRYHKC